MRDYTRKVDQVDARLEQLKNQVATQHQLEALRNQLLKLVDEVNMAHLALKTEGKHVVLLIASMGFKTRYSY